MAKIYYSVDTTSVGAPIHWIDEQGQKHIERGLSEDAFTRGRRVTFLKWDAFIKRWGLVEAEKTKVTAWNGWAGK